MSLLKIGMFGGGTVGGGVYELIHGTGGSSGARSRVVTQFGVGALVISRICVRDTSKPRDFAIDSTVTTVTSNPDDIWNDDSIQCVVEVMGGTGLAKEVVMRALTSRKSVVTANKALLAQELGALQTLLDSLTPNPPILAYEAAVCGGIPIIHTLQSCYQTVDAIQSIRGICNGTTNYILDKMENDSSLRFSDVLQEAQALGYAEADPTADVEGHDVRAKIALLAQLAFGQTMSQEQIPSVGITAVTADDFAVGNEGLGLNKSSETNSKNPSFTIKLIGACAVDDDQLSVYVTPMMVSRTAYPGLAYVSGPGNSVTVTSQNNGACTFAGPGAGRYPTAHSIVADVLRCAQGQSFPPFGNATKGARPFATNVDYKGQFYWRCYTTNPLATATAVQEVAQQVGVTLEGYCYRGNTECLVYTTNAVDVRVSQMNTINMRLQEQKQSLGLISDPFYIPILQ